MNASKGQVASRFLAATAAFLIAVGGASAMSTGVDPHALVICSVVGGALLAAEKAFMG